MSRTRSHGCAISSRSSRRMPKSRVDDPVVTGRATIAARDARRRLGLTVEAPVLDIVRVLEEAGGLAVTILPLPDSIAGGFATRESQSFLFVNGGLSPDDQRLALAHAFAHAALGHADTVDVCSAVFESPADLAQIEAHAFACEFLAPAPAIEHSLASWDVHEIDAAEDAGELERLADYFGVSLTLAIHRVSDAGRLRYAGKEWRRLPA